MNTGKIAQSQAHLPRNEESKQNEKYFHQKKQSQAITNTNINQRRSTTFSEVKDLLRGVFKEEQEPEIYDYPDYKTDLNSEMMNPVTEINEDEHITPNIIVKVVDPSILKRQSELNAQVKEKEGTIQMLKDSNKELLSQLKMLGDKLDVLLKKVRMKQAQEGRFKNQELCSHEPIIEKLNNMIQQKDEDIQRTYDRMHQQLTNKEREMNNASQNLNIQKRELQSVKGRPKKTENEKLMDTEKKIKRNEEIGRELIKEIKQLKKLQHDNGNELVDLDIKDSYPEKIKALMEEIRWAKERQMELENKNEQEELQGKRQREHIMNLEETKKDLEIKFRMKLQEMGSVKEMPENVIFYDEMSQQEMLQRILALEADLQAKEKEQKLFVLKLKEVNAGIQQRNKGLQQRARSAVRGNMKMNQTIEEANEKLIKKKKLNEQYSFMLGKSERSHSNIRQRKLQNQSSDLISGQPSYTIEDGGKRLILPEVYNPSTRNLKQSQQNYNTVDGSGRSSSLMKTPKVKFEQNMGKNNGKDEGSKIKELVMLSQQMNGETFGNSNNIPLKQSIRRVRDQSQSEIQLPEFKLNMDKSSDEILKQLREQLQEQL